MLLLESVLLIGIGVEEPEEGMLEVVGELEGLEEKRVTGRRFFFRRPPAGALSGGSSMGVNAETSGVKMLRLFLRLFDMVGCIRISSLSAGCLGRDMLGRGQDRCNWSRCRGTGLEVVRLLT